MATIRELCLAYILGGLTFMPFVVILLVTYSYYASPRWQRSAKRYQCMDHAKIDLQDEKLDSETTQDPKTGDSQVAAGYFAVCRQYVANGVNGKPPERTTPAGETIAAESPSVYQNMYRTIFDRPKTQGLSFEAGRPVKKARNIFYVVLRHGHLLLFDNIEQLEVRHVIALAHYNVDLYGDGQTQTEGELFIKRNCIKLSRKHNSSEHDLPLSPYFLFSDNCSEKEDFYHSLLQAQEKILREEEKPPQILHFGTEDMIKLVRQLHATEETAQTRWLNALIGRLFLALYKTPEMKDAIRTRIQKKMARMSRPNFLTSLNLESMDVGNSAPIFSNPKLREMTVDGALTIETDVKYTGECSLVVAAVARLDLGTRFRAREVNLVLAVILKKLSGHILVKIKPPPSNRAWVSFESMPRMDLILEPVVSSRQITYGLILRSIESRIKEVICETIVLPNWDDVPFFNTMQHQFRGGIWVGSDALKLNQTLTNNNSQNYEYNRNKAEAETPVTSVPTQFDELEITDPIVVPVIGNINEGNDANNVDATGTEIVSSFTPSSNHSGEKFPPKALRANSFSTVAEPVVTTGLATGDTPWNTSPKRSKDAKDSMRVFSARSNDLEQFSDDTTITSLSRPSFLAETTKIDVDETKTSDGNHSEVFNLPLASRSNSSLEIWDSPHALTSNNSQQLTEDTTVGMEPSSSLLSKPKLNERKSLLNHSINSATSAAKKWGLGVLARQSEVTIDQRAGFYNDRRSLNQPLGRGQPLPPPGVPLPGPERGGLAATTLSSLRRKPVPGNVSPPRAQNSASEVKQSDTEGVPSTSEKGQRWKN